MPRSTSQEKVAAITFQGAKAHLVDERDASGAARTLASEIGGHFMDQFTYAERATDWRGNNNIAESLFAQMSLEDEPVPTWVVCGAGTGGTSATIGRYIRYRTYATSLCVADPLGSVFHRHYGDRTVGRVAHCDSVIEGIGRTRVEPSFIPDLVDRMIVVPDAASIAAARVTSSVLGRACGGSTGTNMWACMQLIDEMEIRNERGSIVTLLCDSGERYRSTLFDDAWLAARGIDITSELETFGKLFHPSSA